MVLKVVRAMEFLEVMSEVRDVDLLKVAKKVPCHLRTVRRAKALLKKQEGVVTKTVSKVHQLTQDILFLQWFMNTNTLLTVEMKAIWLRRLHKIEKNVLLLREEFGLDEKGKANPID